MKVPVIRWRKNNTVFQQMGLEQSDIKIQKMKLDPDLATHKICLEVDHRFM